jgi:hypothetical protein
VEITYVEAANLVASEGIIPQQSQDGVVADAFGGSPIWELEYFSEPIYSNTCGISVDFHFQALNVSKVEVTALALMGVIDEGFEGTESNVDGVGGEFGSDELLFVLEGLIDGFGLGEGKEAIDVGGGIFAVVGAGTKVGNRFAIVATSVGRGDFECEEVFYDI